MRRCNFGAIYELFAHCCKSTKSLSKKPMKSVYLFVLVATNFLFTAKLVYAQTVVLLPKNAELPAFIDENGDTIPVVFMDPINVISKRQFKNKRDEERFTRLYYNVLKVYPIAKAAGLELRKLEAKLDTIPERKHKAETKKLEDDLTRRYKPILLQLTISQGKILIKLIDRETDKTSYDLIKEFRGGFSAFMWQSLAGLFGSNLKTGYDAQEDRDIEVILNMIEARERGGLPAQ